MAHRWRVKGDAAYAEWVRTYHPDEVAEDEFRSWVALRTSIGPAQTDRQIIPGHFAIAEGATVKIFYFVEQPDLIHVKEILPLQIRPY